MTSLFARIIEDSEFQPDVVLEGNLTIEQAEHRLARYCDGLEDEAEYGPCIQFITDPKEIKTAWLLHANEYMNKEFSGTLADLMIDADELFASYSKEGTIGPSEACDEYAEKYDLRSGYEFVMGC